MFCAAMSVRNIVLLAAFLVAIPAIAWTQLARAMVEKPRYEVLAECKGYEIRRYPACIVAQVEIQAEEGEAMNRGFRPLADYIFGSNRSQAKIAMTSPVIEESGGSEKIAMTSPVIEEPAAGVQRVSFIMPSEYTLEKLPTPVNEKVRLIAVPERVVAVVQFSWRGRDEHMRAREQDLRDALARDGVEVTGTPTYARYDPPWTLPLFRRNEVMLPVAYSEASDSR